MSATKDYDMNSVSKPGHYNQEFAGTVQPWSGTDSQQRFQQNSADPQLRLQMMNLGWTGENSVPVSYSYNSEGFRDEEFDLRPAGIALGCSHTQGVGVDAASVWPVQLGQLLGEKIWNLGIQGSALDTCFRMLEYWIQHLDAEFVVCCVPGITRYEVFRQGWQNVLPAMPVYPEWLEQYQKNWIMFEENSELNQRKNLLAMRQICDQHGVPFFYDITGHNLWPSAGHGRDLTHCGRQGHAWFAEKMHEQIKGHI
jgi:hypothetical protein